MHQSTRAVLDFFDHRNFPKKKHNLVVPCAALAHSMADLLPSTPELTVGLRKLLEAQDCFLRASNLGEVSEL